MGCYLSLPDALGNVTKTTHELVARHTVPIDMTAAELDAIDPLASFRERFVIDDSNLIYLDGNSLGRMPIATAKALKDAIDKQWGDRLIRSWGEGWYDLPQRIGAKIAQLIGAKDKEVICCDSTSVNFYKLVMGALDRQKGRTKIVTDDLNFPSDLYLLQGCAKQHGDVELVVLRSPDGIHLPAELIESVLTEDTAILTLSHVSFKSGFMHDMARLTKAAQDEGALVLWDLSHSVGAVPIDLGTADLAVGCTYKYLNGGPGSPAFLYVREDLQGDFANPIWGWFGQRHPFDFKLDYQPALGLDRMLTGTPPILSMIGIEAGIDLVLEAGIERLRAKSILQTERLINLIDEHLIPYGADLRSPRDPACRGSHVAVSHPDGHAIDQALIRLKNVIPDFRAPDNIRLGVAPLYTSFQELDWAIEAMKEVLESGVYFEYQSETQGVT